MEPRNRVAKQAIPIEKNEVFLKQGGTAVEPCNRPLPPARLRSLKG